MLLILFALVLLSLVFYKKRCRQMTIMQRLGIPGPKPNLIFGNLIQIGKEGTFRALPKWTKLYGPLVGFYIGGIPQILTSDMDLIRRVTIKDFHLFGKRNFIFPGGVLPTTNFKNSIVNGHGNAWKKMRSVSSSWFTISKLNAMEPLIMSSIDKLINQLNERTKECSEEVDLTPIFEDTVFSMSTNCVLGLNLSLERDTKEVQSFFKISKPKIEKSMLAMIMILFPSLTFIAYPLRVWWEDIRMKMLWSSLGVCFDVLRKCIRARKTANTNCKSFLQSLLNSQIYISKGSRSIDNDNDSKPLSISDDEIISTSIFMVAGAVDTTVITLLFAIHNLVNNEDIQEKLRSDLKNADEENGGKFDFETVSRVPLLINVIKETLRMYSTASLAVSRVADIDYEYEGYVIPKGTGLFVDVHSIHNDPKFWPEPEKFRPDRFEKNFEKFAFLPFGIGPRNCVGMQFAYMALQMELANLVLKFRFQPGPSTERDIDIYETYGMIRPKNGMFCKVTKV